MAEPKPEHALTLAIDTSAAQQQVDQLHASLQRCVDAAERLGTIQNPSMPARDPEARLRAIRDILADVRIGRFTLAQAVVLLGAVAELPNAQVHRLLADAASPPRYTPPPEMEGEALATLQAATEQELRGAGALWEAHRQSLGGVSSVSGAPLPDWAGCNVLAQRAHLTMFRSARAFLAAHGYGDEKQGAIEQGWRDCVGYLSEAPSETKYQMDVPERTGAAALWRELTIARQRGVTGREPDTRVEMLERFAPQEARVIAEVERLMKGAHDAHSVTRLVVQALLYGPDAALKSEAAPEQ